MTPSCHVSKSRMLKKVMANICLLVTGAPIFYEGQGNNLCPAVHAMGESYYSILLKVLDGEVKRLRVA